MDFPGWPPMASGTRAQHRPDSVRVANRPAQLYPQSRPERPVTEEPGRRSILREHNVGLSIPIKIRAGSASLFAVDFESGILRRQGGKLARAIASQQKRAPGVEARRFRLGRKKILREQDVLVPVQIEICHRHSEGWSQLSFPRQRNRFETL